MKESVAIAKEADTTKNYSPTKNDSNIHRTQNEPERQLGSLRGVIDNIRRDGSMPSVESIATELSSMHSAERAPALLALQQTHGNRYVQRVVAGIQAKLKIGKPGDIYEQEADRVAEEVMRMPDPQVQRQVEPEEEEEELIQTKPLAEQITPLAQRQVEEEEEEDMIQAKALSEQITPLVQRQEEEEEEIQTKPLPSQTSEVVSDVETSTNSIRGGGQPLPGSIRAFFESRFAHDFSRIPVHASARSSRQPKLKVNTPGDQYEQEADRVADQVMRTPEPKPEQQAQELVEPEEDGEKALQIKAPDDTSPASGHAWPRIDSGSGGGRPLPPELRGYFEPRIGHSFAQVRIHADDRAAEVADSLHARAFTVGADIAFAHGHFAPQSRTGRQLLAHELTHVIQQSQHGETLHRDTDLRLSQIQPRVQRSLEYDRDTHTIAAPPTSLTHGQLREQLQNSLPGGSSVTGVTSDSEPERHLLNALLMLSRDPDNNDTEVDMILDLGPAPQNGSPPRGRVTIRIFGATPHRGEAGEAVLVGQGVPVSSQSFATVEEATQALQSTFGIGQVRDGSATWTLDELGKVHTAFGLLSSPERAALSGVDLVREVSVATPQHSHSAAHFDFSHEVSGVTATHSAVIAVGNTTFNNDERSFVGARAASFPNSVFTIIHEVGHAVESAEERSATIPRDEAQALVNEAVALSNPAVAEHGVHLAVLNTAIDDANALLSSTNAALQAWLTTLMNYPEAQRTQVVMRYHRSLDPLLIASRNVTSNSDASNVPGLLQAMDREIATRDQRFNVIPGTHAARQDGQAVNQALDAYAEAARTLASARAPEAAARQVMDERIAARTEREATLTEREQELSATRVASGQTLRLDHFVQLVNDRNITPFTDYAQSHWDSDPGEFYAEAFAVFRTDPEFLRTYYLPLFEWFNAGHHL